MTLIGTERFKKILLPIAENKVENNFPPTRAKISTTNWVVCMVKFIYLKKATKIWQNFKTLFDTLEILSSSWRPSQNTWTLKMEKIDGKTSNQNYRCHFNILFLVQRTLALCYFGDLEEVALAKNCISKIFILCTQ